MLYESAAVHYAADCIDLMLSNEEFSILTKLQALALDYVKSQLNSALPPALTLKSIEEGLENLGFRLEHMAKQEQKETFIEGSCVVLLAHRGNPLSVGPDARTNYDFMRAPSTVSFILKMKQTLDKAHEGYRHTWMLNDLPPVKIPPKLPA